MSMSLDGFVAGPNEGPDNPLGDGGHRLHEWDLTGAGHKGVSGRLAGVNGKVFDELLATGAVVLVPVLLGRGRRLLDERGPEHIELERTRVLEGRPVSPTCTTGSSADVQRFPAAGGPAWLLSSPTSSGA
jgi:hypothetical protein